MLEPLQIRTFLIGSSTYVIVLGGVFDAQRASDVESELARAAGGRAIVDLLDLTFIDGACIDLLTETSRQSELSVVADRRLQDRLPDVASYASLADAVADAV